MYNDLLVV